MGDGQPTRSLESPLVAGRLALALLSGHLIRVGVGCLRRWLIGARARVWIARWWLRWRGGVRLRLRLRLRDVGRRLRVVGRLFGAGGAGCDGVVWLRVLAHFASSAWGPTVLPRFGVPKPQPRGAGRLRGDRALPSSPESCRQVFAQPLEPFDRMPVEGRHHGRKVGLSKREITCARVDHSSDPSSQIPKAVVIQVDREPRDSTEWRVGACDTNHVALLSAQSP